MTVATPEQIVSVTDLLTNSLTELVANDSDIFNIELIEPMQISQDARILNRELHETTLNHRFAYYLEINIQRTEMNHYKVDIEFNRFNNNSKELQTLEGIIIARPDIIIHSRMNDTIQPQHFLVVEAKKGPTTEEDINKIIGFITDENYGYAFGFTVSYCSNPEHILGNLYYSDGNHIRRTVLNVQKRI